MVNMLFILFTEWLEDSSPFDFFPLGSDSSNAHTADCKPPGPRAMDWELSQAVRSAL